MGWIVSALLIVAVVVMAVWFRNWLMTGNHWEGG